MERRSQERVRVRFPCEVELDGRRGDGTVRDLSAAGLCVLTGLPVQEGDEIHVTLRPKGRPALGVQALVWNQQQMRRRRSGERSTRLGLVLSEAGDAFLDLLWDCEEGSSPAPAEATRAPAGSSGRPPATTRTRPAEHQHRVRVRQSATSRTRALVVFASSIAEATTRALEETGDDWEVLDVTPQGSPSGAKERRWPTRARG
jgi:hypothetical protein